MSRVPAYTEDVDHAGSSEFALALRHCREPGGLLAGAIAVAGIGGRTVDVSAVAREMDLLAEGAGVRAASRDTAALVEAINHELFVEAGFDGNAGGYYEPENSYIDQVLLRRRGIPITLSLIYMEVARRLGLRCDGIGYPGHFIVRCGEPEEELFVDPFHQGTRLDRAELLASLADHQLGNVSRESFLAAVTPVQFLQRMLYNLYSVYRQRQALAELRAVVDGLLAIEPWNVALVGERGLLRYRLNDADGALGDLERFLEHHAATSTTDSERSVIIARRALADLRHRLSAAEGDLHDDR